MIVATHNCGCLPSYNKTCASECPGTSCCTSHQPTPLPLLTDIPCCPTKPLKIESEKNHSENVCSNITSAERNVSEIAQKGIPYKEIKAVINDNCVILRTQEEPMEEEYDPPCDCINENSIQDPRGLKQSMLLQNENSGTCRTVTLYSKPQKPMNIGSQSLITVKELERRNKKDKCEKSTVSKHTDHEENPNIFLLRIRKKCVEGDKKYNIDVEFKVPRPWSLKRRLEAEKDMRVTLKKPEKADVKKQTQMASRSSKKKRRK